MRRSKITIVLVAALLLIGQVSVLAQGDRPSSGGDAPEPAAEAADAPVKAATPSSETGMMKATSATPAAGEPSLSLAQLPQDLSPWGMFLHADTIVKAVMIGLAIASLVTWTVWVAKSIELFGARAALRPMKSCAVLPVQWRNLCRLRQTRSGSPPICAPTV
jgi:biopolymer transport protein ExbB